MAENKTILVTGGAGYIGTHCIIELLQQDFNVVAIDNFTNAVKGGSEGKYRYSSIFALNSSPRVTANIEELRISRTA